MDQLHLRGVHHAAHVLLPFQADTVFAAQRAADGGRKVVQLVEEFVDDAVPVGALLGEKNVHVHVAVPHVAEVRLLQAVFRTEARRLGHQLRYLAGGHHQVFETVLRVEGHDRLRQALSRLPELVSGGPVVRDEDLQGAVREAEIPDALHVVGKHLRIVPFELDDEVRPCVVEGEASVEESLRQLDRASVHELHRRRNHLPLAHHARSEVDRGSHVGKRNQKVQDFAGKRKQLQNDLRHHGQRSFGADDQMSEVVPRGILPALAPEPGRRSVRKHRFKGEHRVSGRPVLDYLISPGVLRNVAADEGGVAAARVPGVEQPFTLRRLRDLRRHHARFDRDREVFLVQLDDGPHLLEREDDPARERNRAAGEACAGPSWRHRNPAVVRVAHHRGDILGSLRENDDLGDILLVPVKTRDLVVGVGDALFKVCGDVRRSYQLLEFLYCLFSDR